MIRRLLSFMVLLVSAAVAQMPAPEAPRVYIDTTWNLPAGGKTWAAHNATDFKSALTSSLPGDVIVLDAGVTYSGNFNLPVKANANGRWIYIVSSALSKLPAPGTRVNPATDAVNMPKIVTPGATAAITILAGANHYRLAGLEISNASNYGCNLGATPPVNCYSNQLVYAASTQTSMVDSITIDRNYIHGSATQDVKQGVLANGSNFAIVDSYISDIHQGVNDSQAVLAYLTPGPIKVVNNFISATTEDIMFGGAGGLNNPFVPSDIEIRNNYFYKPLAWAKPGVTLPPNNQWVVKDNIEFKSGQRVLIDHNVAENVWVSGQMGFSVMLTPRTNQSGLVAVVDDITISNNTFKNVSSGFDTIASDGNCLPANGCTNPGELRRVKFYNNLFLLGDTTQPGYNNGYAYAGIIMHDLSDFVVQHNTFVPPPNQGYCGTQGSINFSTVAPYTPAHSSTHNIWINDNVLCRQIAGPRGTVGQYSYTLSDYMGDPSPVEPRLLGNVVYAPTSDVIYSMPAHNYVTPVPVTYMDSANGNYQLANPYWSDTSDGAIAGYNPAK